MHTKQVLFLSIVSVGLVIGLISVPPSRQIIAQSNTPTPILVTAEIAYDTRQGNIYVVDTNGKNLRQLTTSGKAWLGLEAWSPDGSQITFTSSDDSGNDIYKVDAKANNLVRLTQHSSGTSAISPMWSPDGKFIAYSVLVVQENSAYTFRMDSDGQNPVKLTDNLGSHYALSWSPDGKLIALEAPRDESPSSDIAIFTMDGNGNNITKLTNAHPYPTGGPLLSWSPDSTEIMYVYDFEIFLVNVKTHITRNLGISRKVVTSPSWSPDGKYIAFVLIDETGTSIVKMNVEKPDEVETLAEHLSNCRSNCIEVSWSPDGNFIAFLMGDDKSGSDIYVIDANGKNQRQITFSHDVAFSRERATIQWRPMPKKQ